MVDLRIITYNVNGIGRASNYKRRKLFNYLHTLKADLICLQETHCTTEDEKVWKAEWGGKILFSNGSSAARGVAMLFSRKFNPKIIDCVQDSDGRLLAFSVNLYDKEYGIASIYAPNEDDTQFFVHALTKIGSLNCEYDIITGDFNTVLNVEKDVRGGRGFSNSKTRKFLNDFMEDNELIDIWRMRHGQKFGATFARKKPYLIKERLDYIIVSATLQQFVVECEILASVFSDHQPLCMTLLLTEFKPGRGYWKLNIELLEDEKLQETILSVIKEIFTVYKKEEICIAWDIMKMNIRQKSISRGIEVAKSKDLKIKALEKKLHTITKDQEKLFDGESDGLFNDHERQILAIKTELDGLYQMRTNGAMLRCKANWIDCGEKPSKYFLSMEKKRYNKKTICRLIDPDTQLTTTSQDEIHRILNKFFTQLYSEKDLTHDPDYIALLNIPQVSEKDKAMLDAPIQFEEVHMAVKQLKSNKCPGLDGFPVEFYRKFWNILGKPLHMLITKNVENNILHITARDGIISLMDKPDKDHLKIGNWRPLSLLNTDYKIYAKILANRLDQVLPYLISANQIGFMKGRSISDNLSTLLAIVQHCETNNEAALIMAVDMFKAFDSVSHSAIEKILEAYNFGENFIKMVMICYKDIRSAVMNNNRWDSWINIKSGTRQGCNLSPKIFLLIIQILNMKIAQNENIKGITIGTNEIKSGLCADDIWNSVQFNENTFQELLFEYEEFQDYVGLQVNYDKTEILRIGSLQKTDARFISTLPLKWSDGPIKILGTWISPSYETMIHINYDDMLQGAASIFRIWDTRSLSLLGKIQIVNSLVNSRFTYKLQSLPKPPKAFFRKYKKMVRKFLWGQKKANIAYTQLLLQFKDGGLQLRDLELAANSLKVAAFQKIFDTNPPGWSQIFSSLLPVGIDNIEKLNINKKDVDHNMKCSTFTDMIKAWADLTFYVPTTSEEMLQQILWFNSHVKIRNRWLFEKSLCEAGVLKVIDLYDLDYGRFMSFEDFKQLYPGVKITFLRYHRIIKAIPNQWKRTILQNDMLNAARPDKMTWKQFVQKNKSRKMASLAYRFVRSKLPNRKSALATIWSHDLRMKIDTQNIGKYFARVNKISKCTKLRFFQYRIISKNLTTNVKVAKWNPEVSKNCTFCQKESETVLHLFIECALVQKIWKLLVRWVKYFHQMEIKVSPSKIIFCNETKRNAKFVNTIILITKYYIYKVRCCKAKLNFIDLISDINKYKQIDLYLAKKYDKCYQYARKWDDFTIFH